MFKKRTLFVLGAGSSYEVKLPVGLGLAKDIATRLDVRLGDDNRNIGEGDKYLLGKFQRLYIRAHWLVINERCRLNGIPFGSTGEKIQRDGLWCVYQFGQQLDAMMMWDRFQGRWLRGEEFSYPERPENMPTMKEVERARA